jgi:hypothetical protein
MPRNPETAPLGRVVVRYGINGKNTAGAKHTRAKVVVALALETGRLRYRMFGHCRGGLARLFSAE